MVNSYDNRLSLLFVVSTDEMQRSIGLGHPEEQSTWVRTISKVFLNQHICAHSLRDFLLFDLSEWLLLRFSARMAGVQDGVGFEAFLDDLYPVLPSNRP